jgi:hypothetical protein
MGNVLYVTKGVMSPNGLGDNGDNANTFFLPIGKPYNHWKWPTDRNKSDWSKRIHF